MTTPNTKSETWIDCILAIEDAGFPPEQKISSASILLAFLLAVKHNAEPGEGHTLSQLFIQELRKILADPQPPTTQDIIAKTQNSIAELEQIGTGKARKQAMLLQFPLTMLKVKLKKDIRQDVSKKARYN